MQQTEKSVSSRETEKQDIMFSGNLLTSRLLCILNWKRKDYKGKYFSVNFVIYETRVINADLYLSLHNAVF